MQERETVEELGIKIPELSDGRNEYWKIENTKMQLVDELETEGSIEGLNVNKNNLCFIAVAGKENLIQVLSVE